MLNGLIFKLVVKGMVIIICINKFVSDFDKKVYFLYKCMYVIVSLK